MHEINPNNVVCKLVDNVNVVFERFAFYLKINFKNAYCLRRQCSAAHFVLCEAYQRGKQHEKILPSYK
jgi:hypothetical protein